MKQFDDRLRFCDEVSSFKAHKCTLGQRLRIFFAYDDTRQTVCVIYYPYTVFFRRRVFLALIITKLFWLQTLIGALLATG